MKGEGSPTKWKESCESSFTYTKKKGWARNSLAEGEVYEKFLVVLTQALEALATLKGRGVKNVGCAKTPNVSHSIFVAPHSPDSNDW